MKMYCPHTKNYFTPYFSCYGDDQFTFQIQDGCNTVIDTPLDSFFYQSFSSFLNKYKRPKRNTVKTLLQQNPLLNETDLYEDDDPVTKRISQQNSQPYPIISHYPNSVF